jgi:iron complex outermembrane receptor protein
MLNFFKIILCFALLYSNCSAKESNTEIDPSFFSLNKKQESAFDSPSAIYTLMPEDIRRSGTNSIPELLRLIPGVQVARINGNSYAITIRGFNRQFSNKLLVMINGRIIYTTLFSGVFWDIHDYILEDIERIEVIRGSGGAIWGSNAVNGVVNIITKDAKNTNGLYVSQTFGNYDKSISEARYGKSIDAKQDFRVYVKNTKRNGLNNVKNNEYNHDDSRHNRFGFRYDNAISESSKLSINSDFSTTETNNYFNTNNNSHIKKDESFNILTSINHSFNKNHSILFNGYIDYNYISSLKRKENIIDLDLQHFYKITPRNDLTFGFGYRLIGDKINNSNNSLLVYDSQHRNNQVYSTFLQNKYTFNEKLNFTTGVKIEKNSFITNPIYQPSIKFAFYPTSTQTIWSSWSKVARTPNRSEADLNIPSFNLVSNNKFKSETMISYEVGHRLKLSPQINLDNTVFLNRYNNLRTSEGDINQAYFVNNGKGKSFGLESNIKVKHNKKLRSEIAYDYLRINLGYKSPSTELQTMIGSTDSIHVAEGSSPRHQLKFKSFYNITSKIELDNFLYYTDSLPKANGHDKEKIKKYFIYNTRLGYLPTPNLDFSIGVQNVFNNKHIEFRRPLNNENAYIGRSFFLKVSWQY